jgi:hypothetical protein
MLEFVYSNHGKQLHRLTDSKLWALLVGAGGTIGQRDVITLLQEMRDRGYLTFVEDPDNWEGRLKIKDIVITPAGRDLVERTKKDAAVLIP